MNEIHNATGGNADAPSTRTQGGSRKDSPLLGYADGASDDIEILRNALPILAKYEREIIEGLLKGDNPLLTVSYKASVVKLVAAFQAAERELLACMAIIESQGEAIREGHEG